MSADDEVVEQHPPYDEDPAELDGPEIDALHAAGWHLRRIARLRNDLDTTDAVYRKELARIEDRLNERREIIGRQIAWHEQPLRQLHTRLLADDPKRKTIEMPNGTLRMRVSTTPKVVVDDPDGLAEWALTAAPDLRPPTPRVLVSALRKQVTVTDDGKVVHTATGEIVPHVSTQIPDPTWNVDTEPESPW